jgi:hypothetical protein
MAKPTAAPGVTSLGYQFSDYYQPPADVQLTDTSQFVDALSALAKNKAYQVQPINYAGINTLARKSAGYDIAQEIKAYHDEQNRLIAQGNQQAGLINQGARASAKETAPYAGQIQGAYTNAANLIKGYAQGTSGDLQAALEADNAKTNAELQAIGSPQTANAALPGQLATVTNVLSGVLPSGTLATQGANSYAAAKAIPAGFLGYGQQQALGTMGAARQEAAKYNLDIGKVLATRSKLTQDYASSYASQAQARQKTIIDARNAQVEMIKSMAGIVASDNKTKLAVNTANMAIAKFNQSITTSNNAIVTATLRHDEAVARIEEQRSHDQITEQQANARLWQTNRAYAQTVRMNTAAIHNNQNLAATRIANARTAAANSQGFYYDEAGYVHPIKGYHLVGDPKGGPGAFRAVKDVVPSQKAKTARTKMLATADKLAKLYFEGKDPKPVIDPRDRKRYIIPGKDPQSGKFWRILPGSTEHVPYGTPKSIVDPRAEQDYEAAGGFFAVEYWQAVHQIQAQTGLSIPAIRRIMANYYSQDAGYQTAVPQMPSSSGTGVVTYGGR